MMNIVGSWVTLCFMGFVMRSSARSMMPVEPEGPMGPLEIDWSNLLDGEKVKMPDKLNTMLLYLRQMDMSIAKQESMKMMRKGLLGSIEEALNSQMDCNEEMMCDDESYFCNVHKNVSKCLPKSDEGEFCLISKPSQNHWSIVGPCKTGLACANKKSSIVDNMNNIMYGRCMHKDSIPFSLLRPDPKVWEEPESIKKTKEEMKNYFKKKLTKPLMAMMMMMRYRMLNSQGMGMGGNEGMFGGQSGMNGNGMPMSGEGMNGNDMPMSGEGMNGNDQSGMNGNGMNMPGGGMYGGESGMNGDGMTMSSGGMKGDHSGMYGNGMSMPGDQQGMSDNGIIYTVGPDGPMDGESENNSGEMGGSDTMAPI